MLLWIKEIVLVFIWCCYLDVGIWQGVYFCFLVMQGVICYFGYVDEISFEFVEILIIEVGQFGVFLLEKWYCIEVFLEDMVFNVDFYVDLKIFIEG